MSEAIRIYSTAKGYVQSTYLIVTNPQRYQAPDDTTFILSYHMLLGFAVELYLKAYLMHTGHTEAELRRVGHNLQKLLELSKADNFNLPEAKKLVDYLDLARIDADALGLLPFGKIEVERGLSAHMFEAVR
jgi:hypothetical protein